MADSELTNGQTFTDSESGATWTVAGTPHYYDGDLTDAATVTRMR